MPSRRISSALAVLALGGLLLTGCAANSTSGDTTAESEDSGSTSTDMNAATTDQSIEEACSDLQTTLSASAEGLEAGMSEFSADPTLAVEKLHTFSDEFAAARNALGNPEVREQADRAGAALDKMIGELEAVAADPASLDMTAFTDTAMQVQTELSGIGEVCAG